MIYFNSDYTKGADHKILQKLVDTNDDATLGYGEDRYTQEAISLMKQKCGNHNVDVHFLVGGTQTNATLIAAALRSHQGVLAPDSGHISVHETGAIESTGHKVITFPNQDGKLKAEDVECFCQKHWQDSAREHEVQPKMIYISQPTEMGTLYTHQELKDLRQVADKYKLYLYLDGARLVYALTAKQNEVSLGEITNLCDAFYFGGTKAGLLFGEALVIRNLSLKEDFRYIIKQKGALLAKGRLLSIQFHALLEDDYYLEIGNRTNALASYMVEKLEQLGLDFYMKTPTNQQFLIFPKSWLSTLSAKFFWQDWGEYDESKQIIRLCTSPLTKEEEIHDLIKEIKIVLIKLGFN